MGVIVDSSVMIGAERRGLTPTVLIEQIKSIVGDQELALSAVGFTELVHGIYRSDSNVRRTARSALLDEYSETLTIYPYTESTARMAGRIDGEQAALKNFIPFPDLLIGATALSLGFSVLTSNVRHFRLIPGLHVIPF